MVDLLAVVIDQATLNDMKRLNPLVLQVNQCGKTVVFVMRVDGFEEEPEAPFVSDQSRMIVCGTNEGVKHVLRHLSPSAVVDARSDASISLEYPGLVITAFDEACLADWDLREVLLNIL
jgi:hypothetical protein